MDELAKLKIEDEQGFSIDQLLLLSIELTLKSWVNAHAKRKQKVKSIIEEINSNDNTNNMIEKYKDANIEDKYE